MPANRATLEQVARRICGDGGSVEHIGTGGFASTFKVQQGDQLMALKVIDPTVATLDRVERELAALRRVSHDNVARYQDVGEEVFDNVTYRWIAMDFVAGRSLAAALREGDVFDLRQATLLLRNAVSGAAAIWAAGTAHRDLSPNNLLLTDDGRCVIVDLGMARHVDDQTITVLPTPGTPGWMSPEQVGASPSHGDWRSDQFVLGLVGYLLLTGTAPYSSAQNMMDLWQSPADKQVPPIRSVNPLVPHVLSDVIERMLSRQPHRRYLQASVLLAELDTAIAALHVEPVSTGLASSFHLNIGHLKGFATATFINELQPDGLIIDAQARGRTAEFVEAAATSRATSVLDPVTYLARSPEEVRPAQYKRLDYGSGPALTGFASDAARRTWCRGVVDGALVDGPDALLSPYFYAGPAEAQWLQESLACAREAEEYLTEKRESDETVPELWTTVALDHAWLSNQQSRDQLLTALTGQVVQTLYLLVATPQASFAPLGDVQTLRGFRDVLQVMRDAGVPVVVGRRSSSGLLLIALGAAGWSVGVSGVLMNMQPHPESASDGGPGYDRIYVPQLLNHITAPIYALMRQADAEAVAPGTRYGDSLLAANPSLEDLTTAQRELLRQHNVAAMRAQASDLSARSLPQRVETLRAWVSLAIDLYDALPPTRLPGEDGRFLRAWSELL